MPSSRKRGSRKTARKYHRGPSRKGTVRRQGFRGSVAGKIMPPLDVRSKAQLKEFAKRIEKGPITFIMVWAPWCPHCHTMMPHFDAASKSGNRSVQSIKVQDNMLPLVNEVLTQKVNKAAKPLNVEGFPSIIVVDKKGNTVTDVEPIRNTAVMTKIMTEAGPLAEEAGINKTAEVNVAANSVMKNNIKNIAANKPISINTVTNNKKTNNQKLLSNIGVEEVGLAASKPMNIDIGEEELVESISPINNMNSKKNNSTPTLKAIPLNKMGNAENKNTINSSQDLEESIAPSPLNTFSGNNSNKPVNVVVPSSNIKKEAEEIISMASPITPSNAISDVEPESISNSLTPEQKLSGGSRGGSLYSAMARTTYSLAPAAALLATAAMVMKNKKGNKGKKTRKHSKKGRISHRRR